VRVGKILSFAGHRGDGFACAIAWACQSGHGDEDVRRVDIFLVGFPFGKDLGDMEAVFCVDGAMIAPGAAANTALSSRGLNSPDGRTHAIRFVGVRRDELKESAPLRAFAATSSISFRRSEESDADGFQEIRILQLSRPFILNWSTFSS